MKPEIADLIRYRLSRARETLDEAEILLGRGKLSGAANRIYYSMFYATIALLATKGLATTKHSGVIALFHREFVKSGVFPRELASSLDEGFEDRVTSDYRDFAVPDREDLESTFRAAGAFIGKAEEIIASLTD